MTFSAGEITSRLIDREIILGPGKVNAGNESLPFVSLKTEGGLTSQNPLSSGFHQAASRAVTLS
jgi:hypothetical protein